MVTTISDSMLELMSSYGVTKEDYINRTDDFLQFYNDKLKDTYSYAELDTHLPYYMLYRKWYDIHMQELSQQEEAAKRMELLNSITVKLDELMGLNKPKHKENNPINTTEKLTLL